MNTRNAFCLLLAGTLLGGIATQAQSAGPFEINWFTIGGGGGTSTGGVYAVSGTIGQPGAGTMAGGTYSLTSGFWSLFAAVPTPGAPLLTITRTGPNAAIVSWPAPSPGWVLQQTTALGSLAIWTDLTSSPVVAAAGQNTVTFTGVTGARWFRLQHP